MALVVVMAPVAPTGWPREIPEPLGLTRAGSRPSSRVTAQAWAAKASLDVDDVQICDGQPGALQHQAGGGNGADAHVQRFDASVSIPDKSGQRLETEGCRAFRLGQHHCRAAGSPAQFDAFLPEIGSLLQVEMTACRKCIAGAWRGTS